ncbi:MAG: hypothetical protein AAGA48_09750 [Myxococcota bacterium]
MQKMTLVMGLVAALATACGEQTATTPEVDPAAEAAAAEAKAAEEAAAKEAEAAAAAAKAAAMGMSIADLMTNKADQLGKTVTVAAMYASHEMKDEMAHVTLTASVDEGAATILCAMADGAGLEEMEANADMRVTGTLAEDEGVVMLKDCAKAAPVEAEGGEAPADAAEGEAVEGAEAPAAEGDDAHE